MATLFADTPGDFGRQLNARRAQQGQMFDQNAQNQARFAFEAQKAKQDQLNRNASAFADAMQAKALQVDKVANRTFQMDQAKSAAKRRNTELASIQKANADAAEQKELGSLQRLLASQGRSYEGLDRDGMLGDIATSARQTNQSTQDPQYLKRVVDWRKDRYDYMLDFTKDWAENNPGPGVRADGSDLSYPTPQALRVAASQFNRINPFPNNRTGIDWEGPLQTGSGDGDNSPPTESQIVRRPVGSGPPSTQTPRQRELQAIRDGVNAAQDPQPPPVSDGGRTRGEFIARIQAAEAQRLEAQIQAEMQRQSAYDADQDYRWMNLPGGAQVDIGPRPPQPPPMSQSQMQIALAMQRQRDRDNARAQAEELQISAGNLPLF